MHAWPISTLNHPISTTVKDIEAPCEATLAAERRFQPSLRRIVVNAVHGMSSHDNSQYARNNGSLHEAVQVDGESNLHFLCFPDGVKPPMRPQSSTHDANEGKQTEIYCGTDEYVYQHFFADFGPLHLGHVWAFCKKLRSLVRQQGQGEDEGAATRGTNKKRPVYVYTSDHPHRRSNAAVLVLAYAVLCMGKSVEDAYTPFFGLQPPLIPYRDASFGVCTYHLEVLDCVRALARAASLAHFDLDTFNAEQYAFYDKIEHGDLNWIIPGKFLAFSGPLANRREVESGKWTLLAEDYIPIFRKLGVTCVIRFNKRCYDRRRFTERGIKHIDLFYEDGGNPSEEILQRFLKICENTKGAIAVHCKAGLGRTGTNIALYMMKHYGYTAAESIALCRICRPGSIVGPQQQFLHDHEHRMRKEGDQYRRRHQSGGEGHSYHAGTTSGSNAAVATSSASSALSQPEHHYAERHTQRRHEPHLRTASGGDPVGRGGGARAFAPKDRRPTSSPLLMRRHSTAYSGGGSGAGVRSVKTPTGATRRTVGSRWAAVEEELVVSGGVDGRGFRGNGCGSGTGRGRGRGRRSAGSVSGGLQRSRRGSSPSARTHNGEGGGGGEAGDIATFMEALRLGRVKGAAEGGGGSGRAEATSASTTRGKLAPLAAAYARPTTSTGVARSGSSRTTPVTAAADVPCKSKSANNDRDFLTAAPGSATPDTNARANTRGLRSVARSAAAPSKTSLAWHQSVDMNIRRMRNADADGLDRAARDAVVSHAQGGPWAGNGSPYLSTGAHHRPR